ncbi:hypothetical protein Tco_1312543 [Tanacetum coccineum]
MIGWLEEDDGINENVNDEDIEDEDVEIKVDDDAELIFPYEVEGDQTPPPRDESSDSEPPNAESSDSKSEDEEVKDAPEVDVAPEATIGTSTQKPYVIRDFPRGYMSVGWMLLRRKKGLDEMRLGCRGLVIERDIARESFTSPKFGTRGFILIWLYWGVPKLHLIRRDIRASEKISKEIFF